MTARVGHAAKLDLALPSMDTRRREPGEPLDPTADAAMRAAMAKVRPNLPGERYELEWGAEPGEAHVVRTPGSLRVPFKRTKSGLIQLRFSVGRRAFAACARLGALSVLAEWIAARAINTGVWTTDTSRGESERLRIRQTASDEVLEAIGTKGVTPRELKWSPPVHRSPCLLCGGLGRPGCPCTPKPNAQMRGQTTWRAVATSGAACVCGGDPAYACAGRIMCRKCLLREHATRCGCRAWPRE